MRKLTLDTPTGPVTLTEQDGAITGCQWDRSAAPVSQTRTSPLSEAAAVQLADYFAGTRRGFDLPLRVDASPFQQQVCAAIAALMANWPAIWGAGTGG